jgi:hypothetical protein
MGQIYSRSPTSKKLCDDILDDLDFSINITIHSMGKFPNFSSLVDHLQSTSPSLSYFYCKSIYLLYDSKNRHPTLRSNVSGEIIALIASDVTRYCIVNNVCDPYCVEVDIVIEEYAIAKTKLISLIENNAYYGTLYGVENLSEDIHGLLV